MLPDNWFIGVTVRSAAQLASCYESLMNIRGRLWLSLEPLESPIDLSCITPVIGRIEGVVIGCDNRGQVPFENSWADRTRESAQEIGAMVYIKQLRMWTCSRCNGDITAVIDKAYHCPHCGLNSTQYHSQLVKDPQQFPEHLRTRQLPWKLQHLK